MSFCDRILDVFNPFMRVAIAHPRRWLLLLVCLAIGWLVATSLTVLGMYMVACHSPIRTRTTIAPETLGGIFQPKQQHIHKHFESINDCNGNWTLREAHLILIVGSLLNIALLVVVLSLLIYERRSNALRDDPPPNYEEVMKAETPPPGYEDLGFTNSLAIDTDPAAVLLEVSTDSVCAVAFSSGTTSDTSSVQTVLSNTSGRLPPLYPSPPPTPIPSIYSSSEISVEDEAFVINHEMAQGEIGIDNPAVDI